LYLSFFRNLNNVIFKIIEYIFTKNTTRDPPICNLQTILIHLWPQNQYCHPCGRGKTLNLGDILTICAQDLDSVSFIFSILWRCLAPKKKWVQVKWQVSQNQSVRVGKARLRSVPTGTVVKYSVVKASKAVLEKTFGSKDG